MLGNNSCLFRRVAIVGVGLVGGSLGLAIKKHRLAREVVGIARPSSSLSLALKNKTIDKASHDIKRGLFDIDLIVLAAPTKAIISLIISISGNLKRGCIITDVGSTKEAIVEAAEKHLPNHAFFVGSHPLAGSEKKGVAFSREDLFQNSLCLITPTEKTNKSAAERVKTLWTKVGATVKTISPKEHDKALAYISHLPHLLAYGLMGTIPDPHLEFASQGLKDSTRIASSDPEMWRDICMTNQTNIVKSLDDLAKNLSQVRKFIFSKDENSLTEHFKKSKHKRDGLDKT